MNKFDKYGDNFKEITNAYHYYLEIVFTSNGIEEFRESVYLTESIDVESILDKVKDKASYIRFYSRPLGMIDDILIEGDPVNYGPKIFFGYKTIDYVFEKDENGCISGPVVKDVFVCNNGEKINNVEFMDISYDEFMRLKSVNPTR